MLETVVLYAQFFLLDLQAVNLSKLEVLQLTFVLGMSFKFFTAIKYNPS